MTPPPVTREEAIDAFKTLGRLLQEVYDVPREELLAEVDLSVPTSIFHADLPPFQALATYVQQQGVPEKRAAKLLKRNRAFVRESTKEASFTEDGERLPVAIFSGELSVLEAAAHALKGKGLENTEIADELGRSNSAVWTLLKRAEEKLGGEER